MSMPDLRCRTAFRMASIVLVTLAASFALTDPAAAGPRRVTSNARSLLAGTVSDPRTGDAVAVIAFVHVQTKADAGTVAVHANVTDAVLAYAVAQPPSDPRLDRLEDLAGHARARDGSSPRTRRAPGRRTRQSFGTGTAIAGASVPPSTWKILPVTQPPAGDAR